jgi:hemolysin type calcium-binding protein
MATIPGSHFIATAPGQPVNVVETTTGTGLPPTVPGAFNLEVFDILPRTNPTAPGVAAPGYQGLAILTMNNSNLELISGGYAVTDNSIAGNDTLVALGGGDTIIGGVGSVTLVLGDTVGGDLAQGGSGPDTIEVHGNSDTVNGSSGPSDSIDVFTGVSASQFNLGSGSDTINVGMSTTSDTVTAGASAGTNQGLVNLFASSSNITFSDGGNKFTDTVVGFDQSVGDRIHLTTDTVADAVANSTQVNSGADTLITLNDGSTILLKGVTHIDSTFFS